MVYSCYEKAGNIDKIMIKKDPLISVLVCNYNYSSYITETLDSIRKQTYKNIEIIVVDDGSTDSSVDLVEGYIKDHPGERILLKAKKICLTLQIK